MGIEAIVIGTGLLAAATGVPQYIEQRNSAKKAEKAQKQANAVSRAEAQVENARRRRQAIAQARIAQAQNLASQSYAVQESSPLAGVQSSIATQVGANIGAQNQMIGSQTKFQNLQQSSYNFLRQGQERAGLWNVGAQVASTGLNLFYPGSTLPDIYTQGQTNPLYNNTAFVKNM